MDSSSSLTPSPSPSSRTSSRVRKRTEKGAEFQQSMRQRKYSTDSEGDVNTSGESLLEGKFLDDEDAKKTGIAAVPSGNRQQTAQVNTPMLPPRKRGRPRKSSTSGQSSKDTPSNTNSKSQNSETETEENSSSPHSKDNTNLSSQTASEPKPEPRKRGRPRKSDITSPDPQKLAETESDDTPGKSDTVCQSKRLTTSNTDCDSQPQRTEDTVVGDKSKPTPQQPRKKGRPRKSDVSSPAPQAAESVHNSGDAPEKPKNVSPNTQHTDSRTDTQPQTTKDTTVSDKAPAEKPALEPRKRGRPRKSDTETSTSKSHDKEENLDGMSTDTHTDKGLPHQKKPDTVTVSAVPTQQLEVESDGRRTTERTVSAEVEATPVKRKRGRPPKLSTPGQNVHSKGSKDSLTGTEASGSRQQGAKRGRPRKQRPLDSEVSPQISDEDKTEDEEEQTEADLGRGKRRRLKKVFYDEDEEDDDSDFEPTPRKKRRRTGSRTREEHNEDDEEEEEEGEETNRRKRRSLKPTLPVDEDETEIEEEEDEEVIKVVKKKRGRKPKSQTTEKEVSEGEETNRRKRRSLKPTLPVDEDETEEEEEEEEEEVTKVVKKKRGRKPKYPTPEKEVSGPKVEECPRCQQKMESLDKYKHHLMEAHAALYTRECHEGEQTNAAVSKIIVKLKRVLCPKCRKPFKYAQYFRHHLEWCGKEELRDVCSLCGKSVQLMWMEQHQREDRKKEAQKQEAQERMEIQQQQKQQLASECTPGTKRRAAEESMKKIKEVTMNMESTDLEGKKKGRKKSKLDDDWDHFGQSADEDNDDEDDDFDINEEEEESTGLINGRLPISYRRRMGRVPDFFQEHHDFLAGLPQGSLFPSLMPRRSQWTPLSESDSAQYLPESRQSVPVIVTRDGAQSAQPTTVQWGEAICDDKQGTAFTGGCVWSVEWCPLDTAGSWGQQLSDHPQVVAMTVSRTMWEDWLVFKPDQGPGMVQFWTAHNLHGTRPESEMSLRLAFTVVHDHHHGVNLSWCPQRGHMQSDDDDTFSRLGLLAVAGHNGDVVVYSVPSPESLTGAGQRKSPETGGPPHCPPTFKPDPTLTLLCNDPELTGPCLSVAWQKGDNCQFIAGGYAKGFVHLWNLATCPQSVRRAGLEERAAVRVFYAHWCVTSLDWGLWEVGRLVTGGLENQLKVWDMSDTRAPLMVYPDLLSSDKGPMRAVAFGSSVHDAVFYADDQRDLTSGASYGLDLSGGFLLGTSCNKKTNYTMARHAACVWTLSYSPWYNMLASGDSTGEVRVSSCMPVMLPNLKGYTKRHCGVRVFSTRLTKGTQNQDVNSNVNGNSERNQDTTASRRDTTGEKENLASKKTQDSENHVSSQEGQNSEKPDIKEEVDEDAQETIASAEDLTIIFNDNDLEGRKDFVDTGNENAISRMTFGSFNAADVYAVSFNPNKRCSMWLACGTRAGFVRIVNLPSLALQFHTATDFFARDKA